jgi:hypothetical protein
VARRCVSRRQGGATSPTISVVESDVAIGPAHFGVDSVDVVPQNKARLYLTPRSGHIMSPCGPLLLHSINSIPSLVFLLSPPRLPRTLTPIASTGRPDEVLEGGPPCYISFSPVIYGCIWWSYLVRWWDLRKLCISWFRSCNVCLFVYSTYLSLFPLLCLLFFGGLGDILFVFFS